MDTSGFHAARPDYEKPVYRVAPELCTFLSDALTTLYGETQAEDTYREIERLMQVYYAHKSPGMLEWEQSIRPEERFTQKDAVLITYGDLIREAGRAPLDCLEELATRYLNGVFNTLHLLPFFPYSSDRGFSVVNFKTVDRNLGTWDHIISLKRHFRLMFDGVFNHVSAQSPWFREFLDGNPDYWDFFTSFGHDETPPEEQLNGILRPRTSDLLSEFHTLRGPRRVWTTFSADQVDLRFQNPKVLTSIIEVLLFYVRKGADLVRLDAVTYLWDELGTTGAHLPQTHLVIQLMRRVLDAVAPHVSLITETNVPHEDNISYFGDGRNEAQMVYNFALPPLILHTFQTQDSTRLTSWASQLAHVSSTATYFNFLDSHDGIGVMGARGILTAEEIDTMVGRVVEHGGHVSYKRNSDGSSSPYELNITSYSALNKEDADEAESLQIRRYLAARSIPLVLMGVPGVYLHGLLGSENDIAAILAGEEKRSINRKNLDKVELFAHLEDSSSRTAKIVQGFINMIAVRSREPTFHPNAEQRVYDLGPSVLAVSRVLAEEGQHVLCLTNVTGEPCHVHLTSEQIGCEVSHWTDALSERAYKAAGATLDITLSPYSVVWLRPER